MNLAEQLLERIASTSAPNERALLRCRLAKALEESGDYEAAREAMGELWQRVGEYPNLEGLDEAIQAETLLRAGVLTGWIGSAKQIDDAQEQAKNLITESITLFERLSDSEKLDEAQAELAYCYWRQGAFDEARAVLQELSERLANTESRIKPVALLRSGIVECSAQRYHDALRIYTGIAPLFDESTSHALRGKFHNSFAIVLGIVGTSEKRDDYIDLALVEYTAASFHFEQAGHFRYCASVENNLAMLYLTIGRYKEAHEHLDRSRPILARLKDSVHVAQVDETRAKLLLAEGRTFEAEKVISAAVRTLEKGDEQSLLAEALITHGIALARTGRHIRARFTLQRAIVIAEQAGDTETAGRAALAVIEELNEHSTRGELLTLYQQAVDRLSNSQQPTIATRLIAGARLVLNLLKPQTLAPEDVPPDWQGFSFREAVNRYERTLLERALKDAGGSVARAAELLGFKHHQSLISLLNTRHKDLLPARSTVVPRKRSIIRQDSRPKQHESAKQVLPVLILYVEANRIATDTVKSTLEAKGWKIECCPDGVTAVTKLASEAHYALLLFDSDLPDVNGVELVRLARQLPHRRRTPIVMISASDCEAEAWKAGVDAFLRKPEDVQAITSMIERLLTSKPTR